MISASMPIFSSSRARISRRSETSSSLSLRLPAIRLTTSWYSSVGQGRVDVERLPGDLAPLRLRKRVQRPHVVQPVRELDEDDPDVVRHRQQHLPDVLGLVLLLAAE
jgi:hypothetical protein